MGGAYIRNRKMHSKKNIRNSRFANLHSESNTIFDNTLNNKYL